MYTIFNAIVQDIMIDQNFLLHEFNIDETKHTMNEMNLFHNFVNKPFN